MTNPIRSIAEPCYRYGGNPNP